MAASCDLSNVPFTAILRLFILSALALLVLFLAFFMAYVILGALAMSFQMALRLSLGPYTDAAVGHTLVVLLGTAYIYRLIHRAVTVLYL